MSVCENPTRSLDLCFLSAREPASCKYYFLHSLRFLSIKRATFPSSSDANFFLYSARDCSAIGERSRGMGRMRIARETGFERIDISSSITWFWVFQFTYLVWLSAVEVVDASHFSSLLSSDFSFVSDFSEDEIQRVVGWRGCLVRGLCETILLVSFFIGLWKYFVRRRLGHFFYLHSSRSFHESRRVNLFIHDASTRQPGR